MKSDPYHLLEEDFPEGTPDREYLERFIYVFGSLELRQELEWGLATISLLELGEVELDSGEMLEDFAAFTPSVMEIATLVAFLYPFVSRDPYWWRGRYFETGLEHEVNFAKRKLVEVLLGSGKVSNVTGI